MLYTLLYWAITLTNLFFSLIVSPLSTLAIVISLVLAVLSLAKSRRRFGKSDGYYSLMFARSYLSQLLSAVCCVFALVDCAARFFGVVSRFIGGFIRYSVGPVTFAGIVVWSGISLVATILTFATFGLIIGLDLMSSMKINVVVRNTSFIDFPTLSFRRSFTAADVSFMFGCLLTMGILPTSMWIYQIIPLIFPIQVQADLLFIPVVLIALMTAIVVFLGWINIFLEVGAKNAVDKAGGFRISIHDEVELETQVKKYGFLIFILSFTMPAYLLVLVLATLSQHFIYLDTTHIINGMTTLVMASILMHVSMTADQLKEFPICPQQVKPRPTTQVRALVVREDSSSEEEQVVIVRRTQMVMITRT